jgi:CRP-like cAMP-binding protein
VLDARLQRISRELFLAALGVPLDTMEPWVIDRITSQLDEHFIRPGQTLYTAGQPSEFLYFMHEGRVRVTRDGGPSWTVVGRWFLGVFEALRERPSTTTAVALTDIHAMRVPAIAWRDLLEDSFDLARAAIFNAAQAVVKLEELVPTPPASQPRRVSWVPAVPRPGRLTLVETLAHLLDVRMLRGAGVQALTDLAAVAQEASFASDEVVLERGVERDRLVIVAEGEVHAERANPAVVRRYVPGEIVCGVASFGATAPAWEARATAPTRTISFPIEAWFDLMEEHFDLVSSTLSALGARRDLLVDHLAEESGDLVLT